MYEQNEAKERRTQIQFHWFSLFAGKHLGRFARTATYWLRTVAKHMAGSAAAQGGSGQDWA